MIINVHRFLCRVPVVLVILKKNLNFPYRFSKNTQISNFMKICQAEFFHVDVQTLLTKRIIALRNFANALKIVVMEGFQLCFHKLAKREYSSNTTFFFITKR